VRSRVVERPDPIVELALCPLYGLGSESLTGVGGASSSTAVLFGAGVEPGGDVPARDDQGVAAVHREGVPEGDRERVLEEERAAWVAVSGR
jgi:hypothetical protein